MSGILGIVYRTIATPVESPIGKFSYLPNSSWATARTQSFRVLLTPLTLQTLANCGDGKFTSRVGNVAGFTLHAGGAIKADERAKLERLCRYIARPAISTKRLSMTRNGQVSYELNQK